MRTFKKQPSEVVDIDLDFSEWFNERDDEDQIASVAVTITPGNSVSPDLVLGPDPLPNWQLLPGACLSGRLHIAKLWLGEGVSGTTYIVTAVVTTEVGRVDEVEFKMAVKETP